MNCRNCGAPMVLFREREYFRCEYCGSFHFPAPGQDGVRRLGPPPEEVPCPACGAALHLASLDDRYQGYQCERCQGLLLNRFQFGDAVQVRRAWAGHPPDAPRPLNRADLARRLRCPLCRQPMNTHAYGGPGNIVIDTCDRCQVVWLDYGELSRAIDAPGRDRGAAILRQEMAPESVEEDDERRGRRGRVEIDLLRLLDGLFS